jgi:hypothetical protein
VTFSKNLGVGWDAVASPFFAPRQRNYGLLSIDRTHVFSMRYNWRLPKPGGLRPGHPLGILARDWELAGITRLQSGAPFTPGMSTVDGQNITGTPSEGARPDVADPAAPAVSRFGRPALGRFGNVGVGVLRRPGINNWDMSLYRQIRLGEGRSLQLRFETYNTFNHTQFSAVSQNARFDAQGNQVDPLFLQPTAAFSPRRIQLALSLRW